MPPRSFRTWPLRLRHLFRYTVHRVRHSQRRFIPHSAHTNEAQRRRRRLAWVSSSCRGCTSTSTTTATSTSSPVRHLDRVGPVFRGVFTWRALPSRRPRPVPVLRGVLSDARLSLSVPASVSSLWVDACSRRLSSLTGLLRLDTRRRRRLFGTTGGRRYRATPTPKRRSGAQASRRLLPAARHTYNTATLSTKELIFM